MAAPKGNRHAAKDRTWARALQRALMHYSDPEVKTGEALDKIAQKVIKQALEGDKDARKEIGDRLDGKPHQSIGGSDDHPPLKVEHTVVFLDADEG